MRTLVLTLGAILATGCGVDDEASVVDGASDSATADAQDNDGPMSNVDATPAPVDAAGPDTAPSDAPLPDATPPDGPAADGATPPDAVLPDAAPPDAAPACGNGVREAGEQCDDGATGNLDGCDSLCRFEVSQRATYLLMRYATSSYCPANALAVQS